MTPDSAEIVEAIRRERANIEWITESMATLRKQYGGRYIAVRDRKVIDLDEDFDALLARVRKLPSPESVTIEHISAAERVWLFGLGSPKGVEPSAGLGIPFPEREWPAPALSGNAKGRRRRLNVATKARCQGACGGSAVWGSAWDHRGGADGNLELG